MENILLGIEPVRGWILDTPEMIARAEKAMREVGLSDVLPGHRVRSLSLAQQQLVEVARAVACDCRLLVFDEPTSALPAHHRDMLFSLIRRLRDKGVSIIYISHFLEEVQEIADRFTVLRDGETVGQGVTKDASMNEIVALMVGRQMDDMYPRSRREAGEAVLEVRELRGENLRHASFTLHRGEVLGIAGLLGSGRTELLRTLFGLSEAKSGDVRVAAVGGKASPAARWKQNIGMVSEDRKFEGLAPGLTIADNITLAHLDGLGPGRLVLPRRQQRACERWIRRIPIICRSPAQRVRELSGGNQQKVALARLLHADVDILLLDEPTRGIDVGSKAQIYGLIDELASGGGQNRRPKAVLLVSSYIPELMGLCDRIAVMYRGVLGQVRPRASWDEHTIMLSATGQEGLQ
jgi:ribose transport system ATP-binding protein